MGAYFGKDYTAKYLVRLGQLIETELALELFSKPLAYLSIGNKYELRMEMQKKILKTTDLSKTVLTLPATLSSAICFVPDKFLKSGLQWFKEDPICEFRKRF